MIKTPSPPTMSRPPWCGLAGQASRMFVFLAKKTDEPKPLLVSARMSTENVL